MIVDGLEEIGCCHTVVPHKPLCNVVQHGLQLVLQTFALNNVRCTAGGGPTRKARKRVDSL
jgi:hypothetical protein